ncbi:DNA polymerase beta palm-like protein [Elsinoe fawcettii]|nr:DNA polymerase beta palm-like protein [Elsinoe fawcettii]
MASYNSEDTQTRYDEKVRIFTFLDNIDDSDERDPELERSMSTLKRKRDEDASVTLPPSSTSGLRSAAISDKVQALNRSVTAPSSAGRQQYAAAWTGQTAPFGPSRSMSASQETRNVVPAEISTPSTNAKVFDGCHFYFFPNNNNNPGRNFRIKKAEEHGATRVKKWSGKVTHLVVDRSMNYDQVRAYMKSEGIDIPDHIHIVIEHYPAECIAYRMLLDPHQSKYQIKGFAPRVIAGPAKPVPPEKSSLELKPEGRIQPQTPSQNTTRNTNSDSSTEHTSPAIPHVGDDLDRAIDEARKAHDLMLDEDDIDERPRSSSSDEDKMATAAKIPYWQQKFQCMKQNTAKTNDGPNAATIAILQEMAEYYAKVQDTWRPVAYRKAINTLRNHPIKVWTAEEAEKLPHIGDRLARKIQEIVCTNALRRLESAKADPTDQILQLFLGVYGIGFNQGMKFVAQGFKTLEDLRTKANLTENMKIGLDHYHDFNSRIDRTEVKAHSDIVSKTASKIDQAIQIYTMGSYRRGARTSSDIDIVITHRTWTNSQLRTMLIDSLIPTLSKADFLKCALASIDRTDGTKWHGASCLPSSKTWRRIDFLLVPATELGAALIYFTGNDIFNRSMRLLASKKGMRLNQRGLYKDVMRGKQREKLAEGSLIEGRDEKKIFAALGR